MSIIRFEENIISPNIMVPVEEIAAENTSSIDNDKGECTTSKSNNDQEYKAIKVEPSLRNEQIHSQNPVSSAHEATREESVAVEALYELCSQKDSPREDDIDITGKQQELSTSPVITASFALIQCHICSSCFSSQTDFDVHHQVCGSHIKDVFTCNICNVTFNTKEKLENHVVCHQVSRPFSCRLCGSLFKVKKQLQVHFCTQKVMNLICNVCGSEFSKLSSLKNHMKIHRYPPGKDFVPSTFCETVISENSNWAHDVQAFPLFMPQLEMQNGVDIPNWNVNLNDSLQNKDIGHDTMDIAQEMTINNSYSSILDGQSGFHNEFENIDQVSVHSDTLDLKQQVEMYSQTSIHDQIGHSSSHVSNTTDLIPNCNLQGETKKKPHTCKYCGVSFTREKALISHERFHQDYLTDILECKKCGEIFLNKEDLKSHMCSSKHSQKMFVDEYHPVMRDNPKNVAKVPHNNPLEIPTYEPENIEYPQEEHYTDPTDSLTVKLKQSKHTCEHCFKRFTTKQKKFRHMWIHRNKTFSCEVCADTFSTQKQLNQHRLSSHEGNTPHGCETCGKCFASRQGLWEHMRLHKEGSAPHQCNLCGKKFTSRQGYHIHARTHTGERPYGCRYCWKAFRDGGTLRKHERIHTGERPHVCPICHRAFNQKVVLREHVRWLHAHHQPDQNEPFIPCPMPNCQHTLTDKEDLCAHIVKHSDTLSTIDRSKSLQAAQPKIKTKPFAKLVKRNVFPKQEDVIYDDNLYNYENEMSVESPDHRCEMCGEIFSVRELLLSHIKIHI